MAHLKQDQAKSDIGQQQHGWGRGEQSNVGQCKATDCVDADAWQMQAAIDDFTGDPGQQQGQGPCQFSEQGADIDHACQACLVKNGILTQQ